MKKHSMTQFRLPFTLVLAFLLLASIASASEQGVIDAPDAVGIGQPFLVRVAVPFIAEDIEVVWNDMSLHPSIEFSEGTSNALVLLGTRLASEPARSPLRVQVTAGGVVENYSKEISVIFHAYQKETLSVAPKMVTPPDGQKERIGHEHESALKAARTYSAQRHWSVPFSLPVQGKMLSRFGLYRVFKCSTAR